MVISHWQYRRRLLGWPCRNCCILCFKKYTSEFTALAEKERRTSAAVKMSPGSSSSAAQPSSDCAEGKLFSDFTTDGITELPVWEDEELSYWCVRSATPMHCSHDTANTSRKLRRAVQLRFHHPSTIYMGRMFWPFALYCHLSFKWEIISSNTLAQVVQSTDWNWEA